jgi:hypothetical protein
MKLFGKKLRLVRVDDHLKPDVLVFGRSRIELGRNLTPKLLHAMPVAYGNANPEQWKPFVTLAVAMGLL